MMAVPGGNDMAARKTKGAKKPAKAPAKGQKVNELVCNDCGMIVVVEDQCGCGCVPTCCGSPMTPKK
jgi:hypothetical protein